MKAAILDKLGRKLNKARIKVQGHGQRPLHFKLLFLIFHLKKKEFKNKNNRLQIPEKQFFCYIVNDKIYETIAQILVVQLRGSGTDRKGSEEKQVAPQFTQNDVNQLVSNFWLPCPL